MIWIIKALSNKSRSLLRRTAGIEGSDYTSLSESQTEELADARKKLDEKNQRLKRTRRQLAKKEEEVVRLQAIIAERTRDQSWWDQPENIVWIFGSGRTGSSWLASMLGDLKGHAMWNEPYVGEVFGTAYYHRAWDLQRLRAQYVLSRQHRKTWLHSIRSFVLDGADARFPAAAGGYLVLKEPHGTLGAPLLMSALPESRMIFLVRDPRDVVASALDAHRKGSWASEQLDEEHRHSTVNDAPDVFVEERARRYLEDIEKAKEAFAAHKGRKALLRYEDLRVDTLATLKRLYAALEIPTEEQELRRTIEKHSWERIPEAEKGPGKGKRKATPGGWNEDLTSEQVEIVERVTTPILDEFYSI